MDCLPVPKVAGRLAVALGDQVGRLPSGRGEIGREIVALNDDGRPVFNLLQNFASESLPDSLFRLRSALLQEP